MKRLQDLLFAIAAIAILGAFLAVPSYELGLLSAEAGAWWAGLGGMVIGPIAFLIAICLD